MDTDPFILILPIILIALNALFSCAESAMLSVNEQKLSKLASEGNKRAERLMAIADEPSHFLSAIQFLITLSGLLSGAFAAHSYASRLAGWLGSRWPISVTALNAICIVPVTLLLSYFVIVFGELLPKRLAARRSEAMALKLSWLILGIPIVFKPIIALFTASVNAVLRLMHIDPNAEDEPVTEEEIRMMVDAGSENGAIDVNEKEIIQNVFAFDDLTAGEIATHRTDVSILWTEESMEEWEHTIHESRHTMYPVCGETADDVLGVLNAKDYFRLPSKDRDSVMALVRPAYFVPEGVKADVLFRNMRKTRSRIAIVLDEFGGMRGVVTLNDLLEQLVGDLEDGDEPVQESDIERVDSDTWRISGAAALDDVAEQLDVSLPVDEYETFGGFVFGNLGMVPEDGSTHELDVCNLHILVQEVQDHKLVRATVRKIEKSAEEDAQEKEE